MALTFHIVVVEEKGCSGAIAPQPMNRGRKTRTLYKPKGAAPTLTSGILRCRTRMVYFFGAVQLKRKIQKACHPPITDALGGGDTTVSFRSNLKGDVLASTIAHEGVHINDYVASQLEGSRITHFDTEHDAWMVQAYVSQSLGMRLAPSGSGDYPQYQIWNRGWKTAEIEVLRSKGVANILADKYIDSEKSYLPRD